MTRIQLLYAVLGIAAGMAGGAWLAGSSIQSPAEVAARTAPPPPSPVLVPVEMRVLSSDVVTRGTVRFGLPQPVSLAPSALKGAPGLIARLPKPNTALVEGDVVLSASGRPVFLLQGAVPAFRDLSPGVSGEDVRQLEQALARLDFDPGPQDGAYDELTAAAVERFYRAKGWEPFGPTREQLTALRTLEREWADAARAKLAAETALATGIQAVAAARAVADQGGRQALLELASRAEDRKRLTQAKEQESLALAAERARAAHAESQADADVAAQTIERANIALDPRQTNAARAVADARLDVAKAARQKARLEGELALQAAERDAALAQDRVNLAEAAVRTARMEGARGVRTALDQQKLGEFDLKVTNERAAQLAGELAAARKRLGVQVPADEVVFLSTLPVRVHEIGAAIGGPAAGPALSVTDNHLSVDSQLTLDAAPLVKPGMRVAIDEQALGLKASGVVESVASTPGTRGVDGYHFYLSVKVESTPMRLAGVSVRLTIPVESTQGEVTAVPVSAVSLAADGTSRVQVERDGTLEYVTVMPGLSAGGYVAVSAPDGKLAPGQRVVVGYRRTDSGA